MATNNPINTTSTDIDLDSVLSNVNNNIFPKDITDIRTDLINIATTLFGSDNNLNFVNQGVIGYIVNLLSYLQLVNNYQNTVSFNEAFLKTAQLRSSILNFAYQLGYTPSLPIPATGNVNLTINLKSNSGYTNAVVFTIPPNTQVSGNSINYLMQYGINFTYYGINSVANKTSNTITAFLYTEDVITGTTNSINIPVAFTVYNSNNDIIGTSSDSNWVSSNSIDHIVLNNLPVSQQTLYTENTVINSSNNGVSWEYQLVIPTSTYLESLLITATFNGSTYQINQYSSPFLMTPSTYGYYLEQTDSNTYNIIFGNGINGFLLPTGTQLVINYYVTNGSNGNISANQINQISNTFYNVANPLVTQVVNLSVSNSISITGGTNGESIEQTKQNIINNLSTQNRSVSYSDYNNIISSSSYSPYILNADVKLKKSDISNNEIYLYLTLKDVTGISTTNLSSNANIDTSLISNIQTPILFNNLNCICPTTHSVAASSVDSITNNNYFINNGQVFTYSNNTYVSMYDMLLVNYGDYYTVQYYNNNEVQLMFKNPIINNGDGTVTIYDIPLIEQSYYNDTSYMQFLYLLISNIYDYIININSLSDNLYINFQRTSGYIHNIDIPYYVSSVNYPASGAYLNLDYIYNMSGSASYIETPTGYNYITNTGASAFGNILFDPALSTAISSSNPVFLSLPIVLNMNVIISNNYDTNTMLSNIINVIINNYILNSSPPLNTFYITQLISQIQQIAGVISVNYNSPSINIQSDNNGAFDLLETRQDIYSFNSEYLSLSTNFSGITVSYQNNNTYGSI